MQGLTRLDAAIMALGVAVMDTWDDTPEWGRIEVHKVDGQPEGSRLIARLIAEVMNLEKGNLNPSEQ